VCEYVTDAIETDRTEHEKDQDLELKWLNLAEIKQAFSTITESYKYDTWMQREAVIIPELRKYIK
jgi:HD superfamily phosphohydrolase YqeK